MLLDGWEFSFLFLPSWEAISMQDLHSYRAYFLSASDHIRAVSSFNSTDDAAACGIADLMLEQSEYAAIEIYEGWRLIWRKAREQQAA